MTDLPTEWLDNAAELSLLYFPSLFALGEAMGGALLEYEFGDF
jgi:hypothetical protein